MTHLELIHSNKLAKYNRDAYNKTMQRREFRNLKNGPDKDVCFCIVCSYYEDNVPVGEFRECNCGPN